MITTAGGDGKSECTAELVADVLALLKEQGELIDNLEQEIRDKNKRLKERAQQVDTMLKEKEPKQIVRKQGKRESSDGSIDFFGEWYCPRCGKLLNRGFDLPWIEFCYKCGQAVKWT